MKKMRKLIPAFCMLLLSAVMLSTSTFAWFSMNTTVTAASMQIKATTNANLYIAKGASVDVNSVTGTSVADLGVTANAVKPCDMSASAGTVTVKEAATFSSEPTVDNAGTAATYTDIGTVTSTTPSNEAGKDISNYAAVGFVTIARKQTTASTYDLTPTCTITLATESNLNKALRAGLIINNVFYESNDVNTASGTATFAFSAITGLADNTAYSVALLIWFEGEDSDCFVNNAITVSQNTASWSFTAADHT